MDETLLICYLWPARRKACAVAIAEALALLGDLHATVSEKGPLSEQGGLFWLLIPADQLEATRLRLPRLGYTATVEWLEPIAAATGRSKSQRSLPKDVVQWHHRWYRCHRLYEGDAEELREAAPDRRTFWLATSDGQARPVTGYRGDGGVLSRRGLAVPDARLLVNLVAAPTGCHFLDPFAGVGGLVIEALASGYEVTSVDCDPVLQLGLLQLGAHHLVADARHLPFADETFDAIATEPPYHEEATPVVVEALQELYRVLKPGRRLAMLCAASQAEVLRQQGAQLGLHIVLDAAIDRKGLAVVLLVWLKRTSSP